MLSLVPQSDCAQAREGVSARLDGELSEHENARLDMHLRGCAECRAYAGEVETITAGLRATPLERPEIRVIMPHRRRIPMPPAAAATAAARPWHFPAPLTKLGRRRLRTETGRP